MNSIIEVNISDYNDVVEKFDKDKLSNELGSFIYNQGKALEHNKKIKINIKNFCKLTNKQKNDIIDMIHSYFRLEVKKIKMTSKHQNKIQIILMILGVVFIGLANLSFFKELSIISELLVIAGWVVIWDVVYNIFFTNIQKQMKLKRYKLLSKAHIEYKD